MHNFTAIMLVGIAFLVGFSMTSLYAQNQTTQYAPVVASSDALLTAITSIVIAIGSVIAMLVRAGVIDKKVGSVAVMASDAAVAVQASRQDIKDVVQTSYDVAKITSPEATKAADEKLTPLLDQVSERVDEYTPKVNKFAELGAKLSNKGQTTTSEIKDDEQLKDEIPDKIVPS